MLLMLLVAAAPVSPRLFHPRQDAPVRAAIVFQERIDAADVSALRRAGALPVELPVGGFAIVGRVVSVDVLQADLQRVAAVRGVKRIDPVIPPIVAQPLDLTAVKVGAPYAWSTPADERFTGKGIVVADHEGGWNVFHPDFFFLDGGLYDFEDRDGDSIASAGDGVDVDQDGTFEATLSLLQGISENWYTGERLEESGFQPDIDWLFVDTDGDGLRDAGAGFAEDVPGLGEPTFVGDDVDRNGTIDRYEKLLRLGTPKVRAVVESNRPYLRGTNLTTYPLERFDLSHGTGAVGIVSAGAIGVRRWTGIAPEAELVLISSDDPVAGLAMAQSLGAHVSFYEWNSPADRQDGSGAFETALSDAAAGGMVQLAAAGNLANADHVMELVDLDGTRRVDLSTDGFGVYAYRAFWLNVHWNAPRSAISLVLSGRDGGTLEVNGSMTSGVVDGIGFTAFAEETPAGNGSALLVGSTLDGNALPNTVLSLDVTTSSASVGLVRGVLFDDQAGWGKGVSWLTDRTDFGSALMPSTSDTVIAVAAYGGRHDLDMFGWGLADERRSYSGMGPRIDGAPLVDVSAPDDPFSPAWTFDPTVLYSTFGGTSGALPHAAGSAAVLLSSGIPFSHAAIESLLHESAKSDAFTGEVPNEAYGWGKVDVARALSDMSYTNPMPPTITLSGPATTVVGRPFEVTAAIAQPNGSADPILIAWDIGYDGSEGVPLTEGRVLTTTPGSLGPLRILARAHHSLSGRNARALFVTEVVDDCANAGCSAGTCCLASGSCGECPPPDAGIVEMDGSVPADAGSMTITQPRRRDSGCACSSSGTQHGSLLLLLVLIRKRATRL